MPKIPDITDSKAKQNDALSDSSNKSVKCADNNHDLQLDLFNQPKPVLLETAQNSNLPAENKALKDYLKKNSIEELSPNMNEEQSWFYNAKSHVKSQVKSPISSSAKSSNYNSANHRKKNSNQFDNSGKKSTKFFNNLAFKISFSLCLLNLVLIGYFATKQYLDFAKETRSDVVLASKRIAAEFADFLNYTDLLLSSVNANFDRIKPDISEMSGNLAYFEKFRQRGFSKESLTREGILYWIDSNRYLVASSIGKIKKPVNLFGRDYLENCYKKPGKLQIGQPIVGALSGQPIIPFAVGLVSEKGAYIGTSVLSLQIENIIENLSKLDDKNLGQFAILDFDKEILVESKKGFFSENKKFARLIKELDLKNSESEIGSFIMAVKRKQEFFIKSQVPSRSFVVIFSVSGAKLHNKLLSKMYFFAAEALFSGFLMILLLIRYRK